MNSQFEALNPEGISLDESEQIKGDALKTLAANSITQPIKAHERNVAPQCVSTPNLPPQTESALPIEAPVTPIELKRMLVVDDLPVNRKLIGIQLQKLGYEVDMVDNAQSAIQKIKEEEYAVVFMDLEMPGLDGFKAAIEIRQHDLENRQHTPIIGLSVYPHDGERERSVSAGMDALISKSISSRKLQTYVDQYRRRFSENSTSTMALPASSPAKIEIDFQLLHDTHGRMDEAIIDLALGSMKTFIGCLKCAIEDRDLTNIKHFAQALKSPCATLGLKSMTKLSVRILSDVVKGEWNAAAQGMTLLEIQYSQILDQLTGLSATLHRVDENTNTNS